MAHASNPQILLAFDFGLRRLGVATANLATRTASPLTTLRVDGDIPWPDIDRVIGDWQPAQLVVGLPEGEGTARSRGKYAAFVAQLVERYRLPVATVDETLTSAAAQTELTTRAAPDFCAAAWDATARTASPPA